MEWYKQWFGEAYSELYAHRDEIEAARQAAFISETLDLFSDRNTLILDVACGWGRHIAEFKRRGLRVVGADLSRHLLQQALGTDAGLDLVRADMRRLPFRGASFSLLTSFFTSFGYFDTDFEHRELLAEWRRLLRPAGVLIIDYMNKPFIVQNLVSETIEKYRGGRAVQRRRIINGRVQKTIELQNQVGDTTASFIESVRLYSAEDLQGLLIDAGFTDVALKSGDDFGELKDRSRSLLALAKNGRGS